jgi:hypothetical protein
LWIVPGEHGRISSLPVGIQRRDAPWREGDVIGIACDLVQMQMHVSLNGSFAAPDVGVFELDPGAVGEGLVASFSGHRGKVRFDLGGARFRYAAPSS